MALIIKEIDVDITKTQFEHIKNLLIQLYPKNMPLSYQSYRNTLLENKIRVFSAEENNRIIAIATLVIYKKLGGIVATIEDVVVDNSERGKGVGTKLTRKLLEEAKKAGVNFVDVNTRRPDAKAFYEKLGFTDKTKDRPFYSLRYYF
ncbi:GCN5-related N-acetyltransferase [archaeon GW2011_AR15]|nr:GCN5-related N-acetyltransferase [archaeon GW2011_AR15]MBS3103585.1 GNAT family N-acetyltransferase [Candidatus Woesearchaeota archaeon]